MSSFAMMALAASATALAVTPSRGVVRTIGVDFGLARVGVAVSSGFAPLPLTVLSCGGAEEAEFISTARAVARYCAGEGAVQVVLGMPYNSSGGEGEQATITREFASHLADAVAPRPVFLWDERFSSTVASMRMNGGKGAVRGECIDAAAAAVILEDFFDAEDDAVAQAPHIPTSAAFQARQAAAAASRPPLVARPTPKSQSEVRREMMQRAAREEEAAAEKRRSKRAKKRT